MAIETKENITQVAIEDEMQRSYLDYAMSVIVSRALPDVRDGLKPVHRRIIFAMNETGNHFNKPHRKSARVVGEVMGKYHPHGDAAIYDTMVRLAQYFSLRVPLVDGQGNFGSMDGDFAAASRYTEARMSLAAHEMVADIDFDTVDFMPNYDNTIEEPIVLPARFPNLLVNGAGGIAVGMATNIPTHNLGEVIDACCMYIDNPDISINELMNCVLGPDFPTGGIIVGTSGIKLALTTGHGSVVVRAATKFEKRGNDRDNIVITEIPYQVNKAKMVEKIADLVKDKVIEGISDIRDESNKEGVHVVIELKKDAVPAVILNKLFKFTTMQISFGYNMLALVKNRPVRLSLKDILVHFIDFRYEVVVRRSKFSLRKNREKAHIFMGFAIAIANIDRVIHIIRSSSDRTEAKCRLLDEVFDAENIRPVLKIVDGNADNVDKYRLTEQQTNAILDLRLHRLTGLEREKIQKDLEEVTLEIEKLIDLLGSREKIISLIKEELLEVKAKFSTPRLTAIEQAQDEVNEEDLIASEDMVVTVTLGGYIKRVPLATYREQRRGGKGRSGMNTKEEDIVQSVYVANTHDDVLFFTSIGRVHKLKVFKLPLGTPISKGRSIVNILKVSAGETVSTVLVLDKARQEDENLKLVFATSLGMVRKSNLSDFVNINSSGKTAIKLEDGEKLIDVDFCREDADIYLATRNGLCNRFDSSVLRTFLSRNTNGVRGIKLKAGDELISMSVLDRWELVGPEERDKYLSGAQEYRTAALKLPRNGSELVKDRMLELARKEKFILTITENGFGKIASCYEFKATGRGTQGVFGIKVCNKNGPVVVSKVIDGNGTFILITNKGKILRSSINDVRVTRRSSMGVIIMRLEDNEKVTSVSLFDDTESLD